MTFDSDKSLSVRWKNARTWNGVRVTLADYVCGPGPVLTKCPNRDRTRLTVMLEEVGGRCEPRLHPTRPCRAEYIRHQMSLFPAGLDSWGFSPDVEFFRHLTFEFDLARVAELSEHESARVQQLAPRLRFSDSQVYDLARLIAGELSASAPSTLDQLYGDSLVTALLVDVLRLDTRLGQRKPRGLTQLQLARVTERLQDNLGERIDLAQLAQLSGLSQSRFCHAFKLSTGMPPYRWLLAARVQRAQELLLRQEHTLAEVALATGFADQSHFTRVFRQIVGATPRAWQRVRCD